MRDLVAPLAADQGLAAPGSHPLDPCPRLPRSPMTPKSASAFRLTRTSALGSSGHLSPFALWTAFPPSDYYGASVALGRASARRSRVPWMLNVSSATQAPHSPPCMESFAIAPPGGGGGPRNLDGPPLGRCGAGAVAAGVRLHHWGLGFRSCSFRPTARALRDGTFGAFGCLPLRGHALVPSGFRPPVNPMAQRPPSESLLTASGIQHRVPRRTLSPHPAQASHVRHSHGPTGSPADAAGQTPGPGACHRAVGVVGNRAAQGRD
jgi:hypothetical protein